ncbi:unnamed protein product [Phaeothamnion confervicola]
MAHRAGPGTALSRRTVPRRHNARMDVEETESFARRHWPVEGFFHRSRSVSDKGETARGPLLGAQTGEASNVGDMIVATEAAADAVGQRAWIARGMLAGVAALYGTNFASVKICEAALAPPVAAFLRFTLAALIFAPALRGAKREALQGGLEVGLFAAVGYIAQSIALTTTTASKSAFICSLAVVFVPFLDMLFGESGNKGESSKVGDATELAEMAAAANGGGGGFGSSLGRFAPALLAAAGVATLELGGLEAPNVGDAWSLLQPLCFGFGFWRTEQLTRKFPESTKAITAAQLLAVAACSAAWVGGTGGLPPMAELAAATADWHVWSALLWTGIITTAFTIYLEAVAMKDLSAAESTVIFSTEPLWGTAFAAAVLGETIGWNTGAGAMLILTACIWSSVGPSVSAANVLFAMGALVGTEGDVGGNFAANLRPIVDVVRDFCDASGIE